jgi:hypothetical protein
MLAPTGDCGADIPDKEANAKGDVWTSGYPVVLVQSQRKPVNIIGPERNARSDAVSEPEKSRRVRRLVLGHLAGLRAAVPRFEFVSAHINLRLVVESAGGVDVVNVGFGGDFVDATARESFHLANLVKTATNLADVSRRVRVVHGLIVHDSLYTVKGYFQILYRVALTVGRARGYTLNMKSCPVCKTKFKPAPYWKRFCKPACASKFHVYAYRKRLKAGTVTPRARKKS